MFSVRSTACFVHSSWQYRIHTIHPSHYNVFCFNSTRALSTSINSPGASRTSWSRGMLYKRSPGLVYCISVLIHFMNLTLNGKCEADSICVSVCVCCFCFCRICQMQRTEQRRSCTIHGTCELWMYTTSVHCFRLFFPFLIFHCAVGWILFVAQAMR